MATGTITTIPDGVKLRYSQEGPSSGPNLVFIPGWAQTAAQFKKQVEHFKTKYRVTTYDHRGHGDSEKPAHGYRVTRLAADLENLLVQLDLRDVTLIGHSMGSSVIWAHWDLYAHDRIAKVVLVDQPSAMTANPAWSPAQIAEAGAVFSEAQKFEVANALRSPQWKDMWVGMAKGFFTPDFDAADFEWMLQMSTKQPPEIGAAMILNHASMDWRDVIPLINVPTLVVGGKASLVPPQAVEWIAKQIPGARLEIFEKEERGSHFMFWENPEKFNRILDEFLST
ncbi:alpha/beta-hydrolase [Hypoxylon fuscum]|nr:alpha/beta-hydrolase [Hypoxylon fuscum]